MRPRLALPLLRTIALIIGSAAVASACSGQGEGERCDKRAGGMPAGTSDCQSGLVCLSTVPGTSFADPNSSICCPPNPSQATTSACSPNGGSFDANPTPPDASAGDSASESGDELGVGTSDGSAADVTLDAAGE